MLYDKRWDKELVTRDPLSLEAFAEWLEKQPADKAYCYSSTGHCLAAQYNKHIGRKYSVISTHGTYDTPIGDLPFDVAIERIAVKEPHTFGAAAARARAILKRSQ